LGDSISPLGAVRAYPCGRVTAAGLYTLKLKWEQGKEREIAGEIANEMLKDGIVLSVGRTYHLSGILRGSSLPTAQSSTIQRGLLCIHRTSVNNS